MPVQQGFEVLCYEPMKRQDGQFPQVGKRRHGKGLVSFSRLSVSREIPGRYADCRFQCCSLGRRQSSAVDSQLDITVARRSRLHVHREGDPRRPDWDGLNCRKRQNVLMLLHAEIVGDES